MSQSEPLPPSAPASPANGAATESATVSKTVSADTVASDPVAADRRVGLVGPEVLVEAVSLLYQHLAEPERGKQVAILIKGMLDGSIASRFFYASLNRGSVAGVLWCLPMPGRSVWVWPPVVERGYCNEEIETELLRAAAADFDTCRDDVSFAQCLVPWDDQDHAQPLLQAGFSFRTDLEFLSCDLPRSPESVCTDRRNAVDNSLDNSLDNTVAVISAVISAVNSAMNSTAADCESTNVSHVPFSLGRLPAGTQPGDICWLQYSAATADLFVDLIAQTYIDSIDCPGVSGFRSANDAIDAHRHSGETETAFWRMMLVCDSSLRWQPAGVLLLAGANRSLTGVEIAAVEPSTATGTNLEAVVPQSTEPVWPCWEIVYLGVAPAYRGRGYGNRLVATAFTIAAAHGGARIELAVDAANSYAKSIYSRNGFQTMTLRAIYIRPRMRVDMNELQNAD